MASSKKSVDGSAEKGIPEIRLAELDDDSKDKYIEFLAENDVKFSKEESGDYTADICISAAESQSASSRNDDESVSSFKKVPRAASRSQFSMGDQLPLGKRYTLFCSLIASKRHVTPKHRIVSWLTRTIEEIYSLRFAMVPTEENPFGYAVEDQEVDAAVESSFPQFVYEHFNKQFGLNQLVTQTCWDLVFNVDASRAEHLHVEIFGRFLEEYYTDNDLLFYLYVRSTLETEAMRTVHTKSSSGGIAITWGQVNSVAKAIFGSPSQELFKTFLSVIDTYMLIDDSGEQYVEAIQFLHIALAQYHDMRERNEATSKQSELESKVNDESRNDKNLETSLNEAGLQDNQSTSLEEFVFAETEMGKGKETNAEAPETSRESRTSSAQATDAVDVESEDAIQPAEIVENVETPISDTKQTPVETIKEPTRSISESDREEEKETEAEIPMPTSPPPPPPEAPPETKPKMQRQPLKSTRNKELDNLTPTEQVLHILKRKIQLAREKYLDNILRPSHLLPPEIQTELEQEIKTKLEENVRDIINDVAGAQQSHIHTQYCEAVPESCSYLRLEGMFKRILAECRDRRGVDIHTETLIEEYANAVVHTNEVRQEVEPLFALLLTYAKARMQSD